MSDRSWRSAPRNDVGQQQQQGGTTYRRPFVHQDQRQHHGGQGQSHFGGAGRKKLQGKRFGLFGFNQHERRKLSIPLKSVHVKANIVDFLAHVEVTQQFVNLEDNPVETTYTFPIAANSAVCGFSAEIEGRKIVAEVKETEEAKDAYDDAISSGHGAYLGQEDRASVFTVTVGNLPPGKEATIHIQYVAELRLLDNKKKKANRDNKPQLLPSADQEQRLAFVLPSRLAPKAKKKINSYGTVQQVQQRFPEYKLTIDVNLKTSSPITGFTSTQPIGLSFLSSNEAKIWLSPLIKALKYDFTLLISLPEDKRTESFVVVEEPQTPGGDYAAVFVIFPKQLLATAKPAEKEAEAPKAAEPEKPKEEKEKEKEEKEEKPAEGEAAAKTEAPAEAEKPAQAPPKQERVRPSATEVTWECPSGVQAPTQLPPNIIPTRGFLLAYSLIPSSVFEASPEFPVVMNAKSTSGPVSLKLTVNRPNVVKGDIIHKLYARAKIRDLERTLKDKVEEEKKAELVDLAKRYSLASHYTSFVAIEERKEATEGTMVSRVIPLNAFGYADEQTSHPQGGGGRGRGRDQGGAPRVRGGPDYNRYEMRGGRQGYQTSQLDYRGGGGDWDDSRGGNRYGGGGRADSGPRGDHGGERRDRDRADNRQDQRRGGRGGRDERGDRGDRGDSYPQHQHQHQHQQRPPPVRTLEVSADLTERLVSVKAKDGTHWALTSAISDILGVQLTKLVDGLIGVPVSDYVSTIWATAIVLACLLSHEEASRKHGALIAEAKKWIAAEADKHGLDGPERWIKKANDYLVKILF